MSVRLLKAIVKAGTVILDPCIHESGSLYDLCLYMSLHLVQLVLLKNLNLWSAEYIFKDTAESPVPG